VHVLIVGAGPAGLAVAGRLSQMQIPFEIVEKSNKVGFMWHCHYDRLCLHTVKQLSHLPHLPFPDVYPTYVTRDQLIQYFQEYVDHFDIHPRFGKEVEDITPTGGAWHVKIKNGAGYITRQVVIATGANRVPRIPHWSGEEEFHGVISHSRAYKNVEPYVGKKILVVGMGNTGAEIALDLAENDIDVWLSVRGPVNIVPRDINGQPTQLTAKVLAKVPFGIGDWMGSLIRKLAVGNLRKYGIESSKMHPFEQLRKTGKTPVIDLGTVAQIKAGKIKVVGDISEFIEQGVIFTSNKKLPFDAVILATGYTPRLDGFIRDLEGLLDEYEMPKSPIGEGKHKGLYFVGFDNYKLGGLLGTIFTDSAEVAKAIRS